MKILTVIMLICNGLLLIDRWLTRRDESTEYKVQVFRYTHVGTRDVIWEASRYGKDNARSSAQAVMMYCDANDPDHAYTFEVNKVENN